MSTKARLNAARLCSLKRGKAIRASSRLSIHAFSSSMGPLNSAFATMKALSNAALWAMILRSPTKSSNAETAVMASGAARTSSSLMPVRSVISSGIGRLGFTNVEKRSTISGPQMIAAAISIRASVCGSKPVVSVSTTTYSGSRTPNKVVSARSAKVTYCSKMSASVPEINRDFSNLNLSEVSSIVRVASHRHSIGSAFQLRSKKTENTD